MFSPLSSTETELKAFALVDMALALLLFVGNALWGLTYVKRLLHTIAFDEKLSVNENAEIILDRIPEFAIFKCTTIVFLLGSCIQEFVCSACLWTAVSKQNLEQLKYICVTVTGTVLRILMYTTPACWCIYVYIDVLWFANAVVFFSLYLIFKLLLVRCIYLFMQRLSVSKKLSPTL